MEMFWGCQVMTRMSRCRTGWKLLRKVETLDSAIARSQRSCIIVEFLDVSERSVFHWRNSQMCNRVEHWIVVSLKAWAWRWGPLKVDALSFRQNLSSKIEQRQQRECSFNLSRIVSNLSGMPGMTWKHAIQVSQSWKPILIICNRAIFTCSTWNSPQLTTERPQTVKLYDNAIGLAHISHPPPP